ncbi:lipoate--protein ligase family protein [Pseudanabaena mucicola]|uniref:Lipoate--protein ligase family protein n=1 Tax=Pseudanabaena mucicola FACHB-723 TaxID=2692860 RepID=A0ABR8A150_9CYAN|nr:lipoate--protein ligase family protein [Pseudanabaena mucicola]MBD2189480.1 lipoate--protein ligase family protein [Pseudanabaena mucicola FACHB-723]
MQNHWQIIPYAEASGQLQMEMDNSLLERHSQDAHSPSFLRFYRWNPAAISLGFHQKQYPDHWNAIAESHNLEIVRRPSGGRAVLHKGDLTYAVVTHVNANGKLRSHRQVYEHVCEFLIQGFAALGIELSYGNAGRGYIHNPSCFSTATNADLVIADGRKLIGSAQVYRHNSVLQHGSIAIAPDHQLLTAIFQTEVPVVGYQELASGDDDELDVIKKLIAALSQAAQHYLQP